MPKGYPKNKDSGISNFWRKKREKYINGISPSQIEDICKNCGKKVVKWKNKQCHSSFCNRKCCSSYQSKSFEKWSKIISKEKLITFYYDQKMSLREIGKKFNCSENSISRLMKKYNLKKRSFSKAISIGIHKNIEKFREASKGSKNPMFGKISYPKAIFIPKLGHSVRSSWEESMAFELKKAEIPYKYEGRTFKINSGQNTYTPDFIMGNIAIEVKGWLFDKNKEKIIKFINEYPYKLWIVTSNKDRFDFSFADKVFKIFYNKWENGKNVTKINQEKLKDLINEIRKNL